MKSHRLQRRACTEGTLLNSFRYFDSLSVNCPVIVNGPHRVLPLFLPLMSDGCVYEAITCLYIKEKEREREGGN